jgi:oligoendopeptidase F
MPLYPIDLLNIRDNDSRKQHYEKLIKNADEHKKLLLQAYMELAEKNQSGDWKKYTRFLKFFLNILLPHLVIFITMKKLKW